MKLLKTHHHPDATDLINKTLFTREATRAIVLDGRDILLLHTERYDDYSLPGGGIEENESKMSALIRELSEETGAQNIKNIRPFGIYEEFRPWYKLDYDIQRIISYCYLCDADRRLGHTKYETYEVKNGMTPVWISIESAISYNKQTMIRSPKKGLSVERETFLLEQILKHILQSETI